MSSSISNFDLLANKNPHRMSAFTCHLFSRSFYAVPLGSFDGKVAAALPGYVCTTPNQDKIPLPTMQSREVFLRCDFRYGPDDPTLWPQPYLAEYPHLGVIPRRPEDSNHPLSIMWWNPTRGDFQPLKNDVMEGLGQLSLPNLWKFEERMMETEDKIKEYRKTASKPSPLLPLLVTSMRHALFRLRSLKCAFGQMRFTVTEFQRYYLEVYALLDYLQIYKPRMDGEQVAATAVANCIGAFTNVPRVAQDFKTAGLPVWLIHPWKAGPFPYNVLQVVTPEDPVDSLCISQQDPPFPVIFRGYMNTPEKHDAIHCYSRTWLVFKDPFKDEPPSVHTSNAAQRTSCELI
jgi:hypothetical protein